MKTDLQARLHDFYKRNRIHPLEFDCKYKNDCKRFSANGKMTEAKMSMVGSQYGHKYPRVAIISLDPPNDEKGTFQVPSDRTTEYVAKFHEEENYSIKRPNVHWAMTQIIVKDILVMSGYSSALSSAVVNESYSGRNIENVSQFFAHINVAKCCMNNPGRGQAHWEVHQRCGTAYLLKELEVLLPEIIISQGANANEVVGNLIYSGGIEKQLPAARIVQIGGNQVLWMPMVHPARHLAEIREQWPYYVNAVKKWSDKIAREFSDVTENQTAFLDSNPTGTSSLDNNPMSEIDPQSNTDYSLYKCKVCDKLVMHFDLDNHTHGVHGGKNPGYRKLA